MSLAEHDCAYCGAVAGDRHGLTCVDRGECPDCLTKNAELARLREKLEAAEKRIERRIVDQGFLEADLKPFADWGKKLNDMPPDEPVLSYTSRELAPLLVRDLHNAHETLTRIQAARHNRILQGLADAIAAERKEGKP
ncbi:MAG: hypothetical protein FD189_1069 [Elusimicrobia bacterium]|nr:MAG: hypothetical protein FD189_1069 [Elusimicrobiota bacterium]